MVFIVKYVSRKFIHCNEVLFCNFLLAWISSQLPEQKEGLLPDRKVLSGGLFFLCNAEKHVTTTISIKTLTLDWTHSYHVSSGLEVY